VGHRPTVTDPTIKQQAESLQQADYFRSILLPKMVGIIFNHILLPHEILDFFPITLVLMMFFPEAIS
jgi:hypothetical protein